MSKKTKKCVLNATCILMLVYCFWNIGQNLLFKAKVDNALESVSKVEDATENINISVNNGEEDKDESANLLNNEYDAYIKTEGNIKESLVDYLKVRLNLIPKNILTNYFNQGGVILLTDKDIAKTYYGDSSLGRILGLHDGNKNIVYLYNSEYAIDNALIHEFGHVLDSLTGWTSMDEEFKTIYNAEKDTFKVYSKDDHYKLNEREFFAEVLQEYILNPKTCEASAKKSFDFVGSKINSL